MVIGEASILWSVLDFRAIVAQAIVCEASKRSVTLRKMCSLWKEWKANAIACQARDYYSLGIARLSITKPHALHAMQSRLHFSHIVSPQVPPPSVKDC